MLCGAGQGQPSIPPVSHREALSQSLVSKEIPTALLLLPPMKEMKPGQLLVGFIKRKASNLGICVS